MGRPSAHINQHSSIEVINVIYMSHKPSPLHLVLLQWCLEPHVVCSYLLSVFISSGFLWRAQSFSPQQLWAILIPLLATWGLSRVQFGYLWSASLCTLLPFLPSVVSVCLSFATVIENWALTERDEQVWASNTLYIYLLSPANVKFALCGRKQKQTAFL